MSLVDGRQTRIHPGLHVGPFGSKRKGRIDRFPRGNGSKAWGGLANEFRIIIGKLREESTTRRGGKGWEKKVGGLRVCNPKSR